MRFLHLYYDKISIVMLEMHNLTSFHKMHDRYYGDMN